MKLAKAVHTFHSYVPPTLGILVLVGLIVLGFHWIKPATPEPTEQPEHSMPPARLVPPVLHPNALKEGTVT